METFTLVPRGPFALASSIRFLEGFTPAAYSGRPGRRGLPRAAAGPSGPGRLRAARPGHAGAADRDQRRLAAVPDLGHPVAADPAGNPAGRGVTLGLARGCA